MKRLSSSAVCTVTSLRASVMHSATVRTEEPISSPMSQQAVMKLPMATCCGEGSELVGSGVALLAGSSSSTSTSEWGNSSPRP